MKEFRVVGLMSGTSLDGLDLAYCVFEETANGWSFKLIHQQNIAYSKYWENRLRQAINLSALELLLLHHEYGSWLGKQVRDFIQAHDLSVDFVSSHGHTVFHQPAKGITFQVGSGQHLANACEEKVICDFRSQDVALGGQGAPLVPIGDQILFRDYDFCLNLGGIANVSFEWKGNRVAYDLAPMNMLLNYFTGKIGKSYDYNGEIGRSGHLNSTLLKELNQLKYYQQGFPKSLGYEWFADQVIPIFNKSNISVADCLHTSVHHIAYQIATELLEFNESGHGKLLITGGGAKNSFFIDTLSGLLKGKIEVVIPEESIIDYKEAIIFGFMGVRRLANEVNCLRSVTGASADCSSGMIYLPNGSSVN
ncbi:anhydro-N-acetylmuramic acid kinase [Cytophagales bacterium RKSG123]|nr:anhydro-N-acetylmuramic acid kinase [Xanthovirga aplysinae]